MACGRRWGKTQLGKTALIDAALRGGDCWWLAPTHAMASQVWRDLKAALEPCTTYSNESERLILLASGGSVSVKSAHTPEFLRGAGLDFVVLDEFAYMSPDVWSQVVRPMLADRRGGALFLSTPHGYNHFWELYKIGLDPEEPQWASFHFTSYDNPALDPDELDSIQRQTSDRVWREEYLAQFIDDDGQVFRNVQACATAAPPPAPQAGRRYIAGVDWGRDHDYTAIAIIDAESGEQVALDRFHGVGWALQRERLRALCDRWKPAVVWAEANSIGMVNIEALQAEGLPVRAFNTTQHSKAMLIESLALALEREEIRILPDPVQIGELLAYQQERLPLSGWRYSAPPGGHDDTVMALALAWHGARRGGALTIDFV